MPLLLRNLTLDPGQDEALLPKLAARRLGVAPSDLLSFRLVRKGVDARKKGRIKLVYTVELSLKGGKRFTPGPDLEEVRPQEPRRFPRGNAKGRIVIVGMGPAGLFAALRLAEYGLRAVVVERGRPVEERTRDVARFWREGALDPESNVQFGEGGAGTFSDGKLTCRVKDPNTSYVLEKLVCHGAPPEILYAAKPHIGTDRLKTVVRNIREALLDSGFDIRFGSRLTAIQGTDAVRGIVVNENDELPCDALVLAPGHSSRDTYAMLAAAGVAVAAKPFAVGVRVEHPQELIDEIQYGRGPHRGLPPAEYQLAYNNASTGRSAYSFCMCPGGIVVGAASEEGGVVVNGMSGYRRNSPFANSAVVVNVGPADFPDASPLAGVAFQRVLERNAFRAGGGGYKAPAQDLLSFVGSGRGRISSTYRPGVIESDLARLFPAAVSETLKEGILHFDRKMRGFVSADATLIGAETRTSAPVRIVRGDDLQSVTLAGLYPTGEGAGYAGGIMSAALDGIRVADAIAAGMNY